MKIDQLFNMNTRITAFFGFLVFLLPLHLLGEGSLLIIGGGLRASNSKVFEAFIEKAQIPGKDTKIGVLPLASSRPIHYFEKLSNTLRAYGLESGQIELIEIASIDDSSTPQVDESSWKDHAQAENTVEAIQSCTGIWILGGDQTRLSKVMMDEEGRDTPALQALRSVYEAGGVIAGTSAGAAIQSETMIAGGSSDVVWFQGMSDHYESMKDQESGKLVLKNGFGLFRGGIIDQHFDRKSRFGRLVYALIHSDHESFGFGIDEDTAILCDGTTRECVVIGSQHVIRIDSDRAVVVDEPGGTHVTGLVVDFFADGDRFNLKTGTVTIHEDKSPTVGKEYMALAPSSFPTPLTPYSSRIADGLAYLLIDNEKTKEWKVYLTGKGTSAYEFRFFQTEATRGYWANLDGNMDSYSGTSIQLEIRPVSIVIERK